MGQCPSCGNKGLFLRTKTCISCGQKGCKKCRTKLANIKWFDVGTSPVGNETLYICSDCYEIFASKVEAEISPTHFELDADTIPVHRFLLLCLRTGSYNISKDLSKAINTYPDDRPHDSWGRRLECEVSADFRRRIERVGRVVQAETLERVGRFEEAAGIYERLRMYDEAGNSRAKGRKIAVKKTEVSVDLNTLLKQIQKDGIIAVYRCPHCGGKFKVGKDTRINDLRTCQHCGTEVKAMDIADFLRTALS